MDFQRASVVVRGAVQGVGFRPFIFRLAKKHELNGWILNSSEGVRIEVEGAREKLCQFIYDIETEKPAAAIIQELSSSFLEAVGYKVFEIRESENSGEKNVFISPDLATCTDCLGEIFDPQNRRHLYPFTNCTNCGPRFSIIEALPYDRANTSMKQFLMCMECEREHRDPADRRFHAQPNACPNCGPQLEFWDEHGNALASRENALLRAAEMIRAGKIVALKGLGGFQLLADARNEKAVLRLRQRKRREEKPFALMFPDLNSIRAECHVSNLEEKLLRSSAAPIVLLERKGRAHHSVRAGGIMESKPGTQGTGAPNLASSIAPKNPYLGAMLPYTPLHHLLLRELGFPVVATSGNLSDEPICTDEREALNRLRDIADFFLVHNRPIIRHVDDSIVREVCGRELMLRRARGYAPLPMQVNESLPNILAVGAHLKNSVALSVGNKIFVSQHIGDLQTKQAFLAFRKSAADLPQLYDTEPEFITHDLHPDYLSTQYANELPQPRQAIQHHWAHVVACMAENEIEPPALGVSWDGTGYGTDGTIWGGEFFLADQDKNYQRVAHLRSFRLPGGEAAIKQPCRAALGLLHEMSGREMLRNFALAPTRKFSINELGVIEKMLANKTNSPITSSAGRLFDAVASLLDLRQRVSFEGQAAMELEFAILPGIEGCYSFCFEMEKTLNTEHRTSNAEVSQFDVGRSMLDVRCAPATLDWSPMVREILEDISRKTPIGNISAKFHNTLAEMIVAVAKKFAEPKVVLSGGCFQNKYLVERTMQRLRAEGFSPYWHHWIPPNDGGIALGQILAATWARQKHEARNSSEDALGKSNGHRSSAKS